MVTDTHPHRLETSMREVCTDVDTELTEFTDETNHVHPLVNAPPTASQRMRREFPELEKHYWHRQHLWSGSYFAGSVWRRPTGCGAPPHRTTGSPQLTSGGRLHFRPEGPSTSGHLDSQDDVRRVDPQPAAPSRRQAPGRGGEARRAAPRTDRRVGTVRPRPGEQSWPG